MDATLPFAPPSSWLLTSWADGTNWGTEWIHGRLPTPLIRKCVLFLQAAPERDLEA